MGVTSIGEKGSDTKNAKHRSGRSDFLVSDPFSPTPHKLSADAALVSRFYLNSVLVMWSDLSRCSAPAIAAIAIALSAARTTVAQESLPPPQPVQIQSIPRPEAMSASLAGPRMDPATLDRLHWPLLRKDLQVNGAMSCATSNCHGGPRVGVSQPWARRGMEFQIWLENDPHAQSWRTICGKESVSIMERLGIVEDGQIVDRAGFDNCLACHNTARRFDEPRRAHLTQDRAADDVNTFLREGVGCAGCHGPSEKWIATHFQQNWSPDGATDQGFVEAGDLFVRARMCASCHVGDQDRDMNHDIIAAGHPTLRYELATFHSWQPKHWRDREVSDPTYYEAQLWLAGQLASADASLALLQTRAEKAHTVSTWPEFAAYNCASCHHNLDLDNQRTPIDANRKAVALYSQWDDAGIRWLIQFRIESGQSTEEDHQLIAALDAVKQSMEMSPRPRADQRRRGGSAGSRSVGALA